MQIGDDVPGQINIGLRIERDFALIAQLQLLVLANARQRARRLVRIGPFGPEARKAKNGRIDRAFT